MAVKTIPLRKEALPYEAEKPGLLPVLRYGTYCPMCKRNYWLGWEPDHEVIDDGKHAREMRVYMVLVGIFALMAGLFFVGAIIVTTGGRL